MNQMTPRLKIRLALPAVLVCAFGGLLLAQVEVTWFSIDGGGGASSGGTFAVTGTIGEPEGLATISGGGFVVSGGFQGGASPPSASGCPNTCGDINGSGGNVTLVDFATFALCFNRNGPGGACPDPVTFACSDLDGNGATNLLDFATFSLVFGTSSVNVPPNCP